MNFNKVNKNQSMQGFTLIEMMVVVGIIAILAAFAYPSYAEYVDRAKRKEGIAGLYSIAALVARCEGSNPYGLNHANVRLESACARVTYGGETENAFFSEQGNYVYIVEGVGEISMTPLRKPFSYLLSNKTKCGGVKMDANLNMTRMTVGNNDPMMTGDPAIYTMEYCWGTP